MSASSALRLRTAGRRSLQQALAAHCTCRKREKSRARVRLFFSLFSTCAGSCPRDRCAPDPLLQCGAVIISTRQAEEPRWSSLACVWPLWFARLVVKIKFLPNTRESRLTIVVLAESNTQRARYAISIVCSWRQSSNFQLTCSVH